MNCEKTDSVTSHDLNTPLSQTVTLSQTPWSVTYFMDGPKGCQQVVQSYCLKKIILVCFSDKSLLIDVLATPHWQKNRWSSKIWKCWVKMTPTLLAKNCPTEHFILFLNSKIMWITWSDFANFINQYIFGGGRRSGGRQTKVYAPGAKNPRYASEFLTILDVVMVSITWICDDIYHMQTCIATDDCRRLLSLLRTKRTMCEVVRIDFPG